MKRPDFVTGDDVKIPVQLKKNGATFVIDSGAFVKASLVTLDHKTVLHAAVDVLEATPGSAWATSLVVVAFTSAESDTVTDPGTALLEVQVDDGGKTTFFGEVEVIIGTIP